MDGLKVKVEENEAIIIETASYASGGGGSGGYVDRIYKNAPSVVLVVDEGSGYTYEITKSDSFVDYVVFNPWVEGKKGPKHYDFDDEV